MLTIEQSRKVCTIYEYELTSFNNAVVIDALEHVHMVTARNVGYSVVTCGHIRLKHTLAVVAAILADFPIGTINRVLDDLQVVVRAASETGHQFCKMYTALSTEIGVKHSPPLSQQRRSS